MSQKLVGSIVKCYDFPGRDDCFIVGQVVSENDYSIMCNILKVVSQGETKVVHFNDTFTTAKQGEGMFDDNFQRVVVLA